MRLSLFGLGMSIAGRFVFKSCFIFSSKDLTFKMISQNVLGRESFYHSNKVGTSDTLLAHSCIEKQVKQQRQYYGTEGFTTDFL